MVSKVVGGPRKSVVGWSLAILVVGLASVAAAEDVEAILKRGVELRRKGRDADALVEFQKAVRIEDSGRTWGQVALAEQALGLWLDANAHIGRALERAQDAWVKKNRRALDTAQQTIRGHLCELEVWGKPAGATVLVDGKPLGKLPNATGWFEEGSVPLEISADGFVPASKRLKLVAGSQIREHAELKPAPKAVAAAKPTGGEPVKLALPPPIATSSPEAGLTKRQSAVDASGSGHGDSDAGADHAPIYRKWWFWTIAGAVVLGAGGTAAWILTHRDPCAGNANCGPI